MLLQIQIKQQVFTVDLHELNLVRDPHLAILYLLDLIFDLALDDFLFIELGRYGKVQ